MDRTSPHPRSVHALVGLLLGASVILAACSSGSSSTATIAPPASTAAASTPPAAASAPGASSETAPGPQLTSVSDASLGAYLTGDNGMTLYILTKDSPGTSTCSGTCATNWPPFTVNAGETATAGAGVTGTIATLTRADGSIQVTYMGAPLYYFAGDTKPGDVTGQGVGGVWFVAATAGGPGGHAVASPSSAAGKY